MSETPEEVRIDGHHEEEEMESDLASLTTTLTTVGPYSSSTSTFTGSRSASLGSVVSALRAVGEGGESAAATDTPLSQSVIAVAEEEQVSRLDISVPGKKLFRLLFEGGPRAAPRQGRGAQTVCRRHRHREGPRRRPWGGRGRTQPSLLLH